MGLGASARLVATGRAAVESRILRVAKPGEFRQYQIKGGAKIYDPRLFIQENKFRLGTKSEISEIQAAKKGNVRPEIDWAEPKYQKPLSMPQTRISRGKMQATIITPEERLRMIPGRIGRTKRTTPRVKKSKPKKRKPIIW